MRFKEGSKVEVLSKTDVPSGSWRCAAIVSSSGCFYTVRYFGHKSRNDVAVEEMVTENEMRPCPPLGEIAETWVPGDVVELYDSFSWKMAIISKVLCEEYFLVRLLGSLLEFKVCRFNIRTRLSWQDGKWILIGKGSGSCEDAKHGRNSISKFKCQNDFQIKKTRSNQLEKNDNISVKTLKRRLCSYRQVENTQKHRAVEKEGKLVITKQSSSHDMDFRNKTMPSSFDNKCRFSKIDMELDSDDEASSVGSCSISSDKCQHKFGFVEDVNDQYSNAGSFCKQEEEEECTKRELGAKIHKLELQAYRCTMEALYASGPLSWDKEAMVTNLRLSLNISNDEHLREAQNGRLDPLNSQC